MDTLELHFAIPGYHALSVSPSEGSAALHCYVAWVNMNCVIVVCCVVIAHIDVGMCVLL